MNSYFNSTANEQKNIIQQIANRMVLPPQAIEKDVWITALVQLVFSLPIADKLVFKGGTSLSKIWNVIERFSEDIDLSIDRQYFGLEGDLTKKQLKSLRKQSSLFVKEAFCNALQNTFNQYGLQDLLSIVVEPDGEGDKTYPEPRKVFIRYRSLFDKSDYLTSEVVLEIGIDYASNIRNNLNIIPAQNVIEEWQQDYEVMQSTMIHGKSLPFDKLLERLKELEERFRRLK